ncbi:ArsR/SmtB family transcription factor [Streptomyces sp. NBC_01800]|uniref:ArsR/SmtB family transcription factor n=1 Tax=Streptomyces sp. NBC_01800 TaxID=2975945 RepID=UPI003FA355D8
MPGTDRCAVRPERPLTAGHSASPDRGASGGRGLPGRRPVGGEIPKSTLSHHLKTLREAGVVRNVPRGRQRFISLRHEDLDNRFPGLLAAVLHQPQAEPRG